MEDSDLEKRADYYYKLYLRRVVTNDAEDKLALNDVRIALEELGFLKNIKERFKAMIYKAARLN